MEDQRVSRHAIGKISLLATLGASVEWYDFFLYGTAAALILPKQFFPANLSPLVGLLAAFSTFAVGFVARPIGGVIFGHWGDRVGRKKMLVFALLLMGVSTAGIGFLPGYRTLGVSAPVLLVVLRFLQGFAIGGQWGGATLLITESAPAARRGFYGSFAQLGAPAGAVLANAVFFAFSASLSSADFIAWGWRVPFILSLILVGLALYIQSFLEETVAYQLEATRHQTTRSASFQGRRVSTEAEKKHVSPVIQALRTYPKEIALAASTFVANQVSFYVFLAFIVAYGTTATGLNLPRNMLLLSVLIGTLFMMPAILLSAWLSDRWGSRRRVCMIGAALMAAWSFAVFPLVETRSFIGIVVAVGVGQLFLGTMLGPQGALVTELFGTRVRYSAASLAYQGGAIVGGAFAPLISTELLAHFGNSIAVSIYMCVACLITLWGLFVLQEPARFELE